MNKHRNHIVFHLINALFTVVISGSSIVYAQTQKQRQSQAALDELFTGTQKTKELQNLPAMKGSQGDIISDIIPGVIKLSLAIAGACAFAMAIYGGVLMITARGNEESTKQGQEILIYAAVGIVIISSAMALVTGLVSFKF